jgi:hypothetical protein
MNFHTNYTGSGGGNDITLLVYTVPQNAKQVAMAVGRN